MWPHDEGCQWFVDLLMSGKEHTHAIGNEILVMGVRAQHLLQREFASPEEFRLARVELEHTQPEFLQQRHGCVLAYDGIMASLSVAHAAMSFREALRVAPILENAVRSIATAGAQLAAWGDGKLNLDLLRQKEGEQRRELMRAMRAGGKTEQQIGDHFNVTRQRVSELIGTRSAGRKDAR